MKTFESSIDINAPIEFVWQCLTDLSRYPEWNPFVIWAKGELQEGEDVRFKVANQPIMFSATITSIVTNYEFIWESEPIPGFHPCYIRRLEKIDNNRTHFFHRDEFSGSLVRIMAPILTWRFGSFYDQTCVSLKQYAESTLEKHIILPDM